MNITGTGFLKLSVAASLLLACERKQDAVAVVNDASPATDGYVAKSELDPNLANNRIGNAVIEPLKDSGINGTVLFDNEGSTGYQARITLSGLAPNAIHAIHIHENGSCADSGKAAGGHFNPGRHEHGKPTEETVHFGDLGNIRADANGMVDTTVTKALTPELAQNIAAMQGRAVILHANEDEFTQPTGDAGDRVACGIIVEDVVQTH